MRILQLSKFFPPDWGMDTGSQDMKSKHYFFVKIGQALRTGTILRAARRYPGVYDFWRRKEIPASAGVDLSDSRFVHVGDHIFFEPLIRQLRSQGLAVKVAPTIAMREYFSDAGHAVVDAQQILTQELRIAPIWLYDSIPSRERRRRFIYLDPADHGISLPVTNHLTTYLMTTAGLQFSPDSVNCVPHKVFQESPMVNGIPGPILIYNDSVDSGDFRLRTIHFEKLLGQAELKHREGHTIVRVGTSEERDKHPGSLPFPHKDLRGKTSVMDLFRLMNSRAVRGSISFDTAIAHLALLYEKPAWICMRSFSTAHARYVKRCIFPSYVGDHQASISYL